MTNKELAHKNIEKELEFFLEELDGIKNEYDWAAYRNDIGQTLIGKLKNVELSLNYEPLEALHLSKFGKVNRDYVESAKQLGISKYAAEVIHESGILHTGIFGKAAEEHMKYHKSRVNPNLTIDMIEMFSGQNLDHLRK